MREQESGGRMALGASERDVLGLVLREGGALALAGAVVGVAGAYLATGFVQSWLFGIERTDPATLVGTTVVLIVVALVASYLPARRASRVDPLVAMRVD
jgi:ABC-type antimicrobial peptide transport system permease subunit